MQNTNAQYVALQQFVTERLQVLDPTLDVAVGSRAYNVLIAPLMNRLGTDPMSTDIEQFLLQRTKDLYPDMDVYSAGSTLRDALITPIATYMEPLRREAEYARLNKSLDAVDTGSMTLEEVDAILANTLTGVETGTFAYGSERVFFGSQRSVGLDQTVVFTTAEGIQYIPQVAQIYLPSDMTRLGNQWYIDVAIQSVEPRSDANVGPNLINRVSNLEGAIRVANPAKVEGGFTAQVGTDAVAAATRALTERSPVSKRAIETLLRANVTGITSVEVAGFEDASMQRDILQAEVSVPTTVTAGAVLAAVQDATPYPVFGVAGPVELPFTNRIQVPLPEGASPELVTQLVNETAFVQVLDTACGYPAGTSGRLRRVVQPVVVQGSHLLITVDDFVVTPLTLHSASTLRGAFNQYAVQGTSFRLYGVDPDTTYEYPIGAPLPFTDTVAAAGMFGSPEFGRDYLVLVPVSSTQNLAYVPDGGTSAVPAAVHVFPMEETPAVNVTRVARRDAHMMSRRLVSSQWLSSLPSEQALSSGAAYCARDERVNVLAFGGPNSSTTAATAWDGVTVDAWGRNPGARLSVKPVGADTSPRECRVTLSEGAPTFASLGVTTDQYVAVMAGLAGMKVADAIAGTWQAWGRIASMTDRELVVVGLDWSVLASDTNLATASGANVISGNGTDQYSVFWTVFQGRRDLLDGTGAPFTSYDELAFVPACLAAAGQVAAPAPADFRGAAPRGYSSDVLANTLRAIGASDNLFGAFSIRLARSLVEFDSTIGGAPVDALVGRLVTRLDGTSRLVPSTTISSPPVTVPAAVKAAYPGLRMDGVATPIGGTTAIAAEMQTSLPFQAGAADAGTVDGSVENPLQNWGYLMPYPATSHTSVLLLAAAAVPAAETQLTVSGIPGGLPIPKAYPGVVSFASNQVHIGGAVDAFIKPAVTTVAPTVTVALTPERPLDRTAVLFEGADGSINYDLPSLFQSESLLAFIATNVPDAGLSDRDVTLTSYPLLDYTIELLNQPADSEHLPTAFRITHNVTDAPAVEIAGEFTGKTGTFSNLQFRVVQRVDVSLNRPLTVLQEGTDLATHGGDIVVQIPSGVLTLDDLTGTYVGIGPFGQEAPYLITKRTDYQLTLSTAPPASGSGLSYRIYRVQAEPVTLPLVRVTQAFLGQESTGQRLPYRHPVGHYITALSGLNDDPLSQVDFGVLSSGVAGGAATLQSNAVSFSQQGVGLYDVLVLPEMPEADRYFTIVGIQVTSPVVDDLLVLDRPWSGVPLASISVYQIGHPAVGTLRTYFTDPTFYSVDQTTEYQYTDPTGVVTKFRPSPAESTVLYSPTGMSTDATLEVDGDGLLMVQSATQNFMADDIRPRDTLELLAFVMRSDPIGHDSIAAVGKQLRFIIDGQHLTVSFVGTDPLPLSTIVARIHQAIGAYVTATLVAGPMIELATPLTMELLATSTPSLLSDLALAVGKNTGAGFGLDLSLTRLRKTTTGPYQLVGEGMAGTPDLVQYEGRKVFFRVKRWGAQTFYPGQMQAVGSLYAADVKIASYQPRNSATIAPATGLDIMSNTGVGLGYVSFGYELLPRNRCYSYSSLEDVVMRVTSLSPKVDASNMSDMLVTNLADVSLTYEDAPEVASAQKVLMQPQTRNACSNPLARHFFPAYPVLDLVYSGAASQATVKKALSDLFVTLYPNRGLRMSDVVGTLLRQQVTTVQGPVKVGYLTIDEYRRVRVLLSEDVATLPPGHHVMGDLDFVALVGGAG